MTLIKQSKFIHKLVYIGYSAFAWKILAVSFMQRMTDEIKELKMECTLYLTDDCNLQCSYCYEGNKKHKSYMSEATLDKVLEFIVSNNLPNDSIEILLLGGEPLLNKKAFFRIIDIVNQKYTKIKSLFHFQTTTNGVLLDEKTIDFIENNNIDLSISIDGDRETHNLNRKSVSGKDVYDIILLNMERLIQRKINFSVRMTVTDNNVRLLYQNVKYFYKLGVRRINIGMDEVGEWSEESIQILDQQMELLDKFYLENFADDENAVFNLHDYKLSTFVFKRKPVYCSAGSKGHLVINSKGEFYPCGYVANEPLWKQGSVYTEFKRKEFIDAVRLHVKRESSCKNCEIAFTCCGAKCGFLNFSRTGFLNVNHVITCKLQRILYNHNVKVFEELYRNYNKKMMGMVQTALKEHIPIGEPMLQIMQKVEQEREV